MPTTLEDIKNQVTEIKADCYFDGWDGENAKPPTEVALREAEQLAITEIDRGFNQIALSPLNNGGMDVELWVTIADKEVKVLIEISPEGGLKGVFARILDEN